MTPYEFRRISISLIDVPAERLRGKKPERIETLSKDMAEQGQLQPIIVVEEADGRFTLTKGLQRLEAIKLLKGTEIDARVTPAAFLNAQQRRLQEIMATLNREELTKLERAEALAELKRVYEELYPDTKNGGDRKSQTAKNKQKNQNEIFSFWSDAAEKTGLSRRSIELSVAMIAGLTTSSKTRLRGTWLEEHQASLKALSEQEADPQGKVLDLLLSTPPEAASVADAIVLAEGRRLTSPAEKAYRTVIDKWRRFEIKQKRSFIQAHADEIIRLLKDEGAL